MILFLFKKALWYKTEIPFILKKNNQNLQAWIFLRETIFCFILNSIDEYKEMKWFMFWIL